MLTFNEVVIFLVLFRDHEYGILLDCQTVICHEDDINV